MPRVQQTFTIIPELGPRARANNEPVRPMTSKQVKKAYKEANKKPRISKAEQRRLELAEQERIRKEFEKEKQAARAKAARDRKKEKELAQKEARRRSGKPLVDVRPSQDTISRFVRGNGTSKKRDGTGQEVAQNATPLAAVAEETDTRTENETEAEVIDLIDSGKVASADDRDSHDGVPDPEPSPILPRNSQRSSQRQLLSHVKSMSSQRPKRPRLESRHESSQPRIRERNLKRNSQPSSNYPADDNLSPRPSRRSDRNIARSSDMPCPSRNGSFHIEEPVQPEIEQDERTGPATPEALLVTEGSHHTGKSIPLSGKSSHGDSLSSCRRQSQKHPPSTQRTFKRCESFNLDPDDLVDDESLLELDGVLNGNGVGSKKSIPCDDGFPPLRPNAGNEKAQMQTAGQKEDSQSSLDFDMLENMNAVFDEMAACQPPSGLLETIQENDAVNELDSHPPSHSKALADNRIGVGDSFEDDGLDDGALLCLDGLETKPTDAEPSSGKILTKPTALTEQTSRNPRQPTSYERDLGLLPKRTSPKSYMPLSTQAILSDLNDFFPSPSQQAREIDDFPASIALNTPCPPVIEKEEPVPQEDDPSPPPQIQKRFFTSSGSNELYSLAIQRSRRTAAMEEIRKKERHRYEAGLQAQARKQAAARGQTVQKTTHRIPQPVPAPVAQQVRPNASTHTSGMPCRPPVTSSRVNVPCPAQSKNSPTYKPAEAITKAPLTRKELSKMISDNKENSTHQPRVDDKNKHDDGPNASQETEYGGDWIDDAWTDGFMI